MKVSLEHLYHYRCDTCQRWWTIADIKPEISSVVYCPHCGLQNIVEAIETHAVDKVGSANANDATNSNPRL